MIAEARSGPKQRARNQPASPKTRRRVLARIAEWDERGISSSWLGNGFCYWNWRGCLAELIAAGLVEPRRVKNRSLRPVTEFVTVYFATAAGLEELARGE